jgi:hypothetical protein
MFRLREWESEERGEGRERRRAGEVSRRRKDASAAPPTSERQSWERHAGAIGDAGIAVAARGCL